MVATYIQELLATNNRVIVPNYGAFLVRATSKSKDAKSLEEKLKDIYFSPFLKFNDELLEKYIIKKEGVTKEEAAQKITEFIDSVKKELEAEKPFVIKGFGQFEADRQGKVQFITIAKEEKVDKEKKETKETTKKPSTAKPASPAGGKAASTTPKKDASKKEEAKAEEKGKKETEKPKTEVKPEEKKEEKKETGTKLQEYKEEKKEPVATNKTTTPVSSTQPKSIYSYKKEKKPINKGLVWSIAIGVPVAVIFIWALLNFNTVKKVFNKDKAKTEKVAKRKAVVKNPAATTKKKTTEQAKNEKQQVAAKKKTPKVEEKKTPVKPQKKYYIIAGSFKNEKYANSFLNKLKAEGYNAEKLTERNGMYAVSYNSFADKRKAIAEYKFLVQEKGLQAWILYY